MTSVFDALARIVEAYKECFEFKDYMILSEFVQAVHNLQHEEGTHRIDGYIQNYIVPKERFRRWMNPFSAEKLAEKLKGKRRDEGEIHGGDGKE